MNDPHGSLEPLTIGPAPDEAAGALVLAHGRGGDAPDMLGLASHLATDSLHVVAIQALNNSWYPSSFLAPTEDNEPGRSSALARIASVLAGLSEAGVPLEKTAIGGFSQGACLSLEYVTLHPARYGAVLGFSGGVMGPLGRTFERSGSLLDSPVFLGCSDRDAHIPLGRVEETGRLLERMGARVDLRIYPGMGHTINRDELDRANDMLQGMVDR